MTLDRPAGRPAAPPITFARLTAIEWRKMLSSRASRWVAGLVALTVLGAVTVSVIYAGPGQVAQGWVEYFRLAAFGLSLLLPVLAILAITSEWTQRTALVTFTQEPRRGRVLAAKVVAGMVLALIGLVLAAVLATGGAALSDALGRDVVWAVAWQPVVTVVAYNLLNVLMGVAFAALLHNTAATIVLFYLQGVVWGILSALAPLQDAANWLDPNRSLTWISDGALDGHASHIAVALGVWIALPLVAGLARTVRREVS